MNKSFSLLFSIKEIKKLANGKAPIYLRISLNSTRCELVTLQKVENPEAVSGWMPAQNRIIYSTTGYGIESSKSAIVNVKNNNGKFQLINNISNSVVH
jgi:hypothetical protein